MQFAITDENGLIVEIGSGQTMPSGAWEVSAPSQADTAALLQMMVVGSELVARPSLAGISIAGAIITLPAYPADTLVEVFDLLGEERIFNASGSGDLVFDLIDAGDYEITISPPSPYLPEIHRITVP